jgi:hypothetical protein
VSIENSSGLTLLSILLSPFGAARALQPSTGRICSDRRTVHIIAPVFLGLLEFRTLRSANTRFSAMAGLMGVNTDWMEIYRGV